MACRLYFAGEVYLAPVDTNTAGLFFGRGVLQYAPLNRVMDTHHPTVMACNVVFLHARCTSPLPAHRCGMPTNTRCSHDCISDELHPIHTIILHLAYDSIDPDAVRQYHDGIIPHSIEHMYDHKTTVDSVRACRHPARPVMACRLNRILQIGTSLSA